MTDHTAHLGARYATFALAAFGAAFSAALLFVVLSQPQLIEEKLKNFAIGEVSAKANDLLGVAAGSENTLLRGLTERFTNDLVVQEQDLETAIAVLVQQRCGKDCNEVRGAALLDGVAIVSQIRDLKVGQKTIAAHLLDRYDATVAGLLGDLKTFGTTNLIAFLTLIFLTVFKGRFGRKILPMTILLAGYVCAAVYWYVLGQDWASAILFNNWAAAGYVFTMGVVYFLLIDFTFLNGRLTRLIGDMIGTAASAIPG